MAIDIRFVALERWPVQPTPSYKRRDGTFKASWSSTIDLLEKELEHLRAKNVVIQADCDRDQIRLDGFMRSNAKLRGPGVVLSFETDKGAYSFPCDSFKKWEANVRGIALSLEALRAVDRYGVTQSAEQYKGWSALPDIRHEKQSKQQAAAEWMVQQSFELGDGNPPTVARVLTDEETRRILYKRLAVFLHPDRIGTDDKFKQLQNHIACF